MAAWQIAHGRLAGGSAGRCLVRGILKSPPANYPVKPSVAALDALDPGLAVAALKADRDRTTPGVSKRFGLIFHQLSPSLRARFEMRLAGSFVSGPRCRGGAERNHKDAEAAPERRAHGMVSWNASQTLEHATWFLLGLGWGCPNVEQSEP
jgi:hypothetical protein